MGRVAKVITVSLKYKSFVEIERKSTFSSLQRTYFFHANTFLLLYIRDVSLLLLLSSSLFLRSFIQFPALLFLIITQKREEEKGNRVAGVGCKDGKKEYKKNNFPSSSFSLNNPHIKLSAYKLQITVVLVVIWKRELETGMVVTLGKPL